MQDSNHPQINTECDDDFEQWAIEQAREYDELEQDRFACGGQNCAGAHIPEKP